MAEQDGFHITGAILRGEKALDPEMKLQPKMSASIFPPMGVGSPLQLADVAWGCGVTLGRFIE
jgi:hypothetical protein